MAKFKSLLFVLGLLVCETVSALSFSIDGIHYTVISGTSTVSVAKNSDGYSGSLTIPSKVTYNSITYDVVSIGKDAFYENKDLITVSLPKTIVTIEASAFALSGLQSLVMPNSVLEIKDAAFSGCSSLISITLSHNLKTIGTGAFRNCTAITEISIPKSVTDIGLIIFNGCTNLKKVTFNCPQVYESCKEMTSIEEIVLGDGVETVMANAFQNCTGLSSLVIGNTVNSIEMYAFDGCSKLTKLTLGNGVKSIGSFAFAKCENLKEVYVPQYANINITAFTLCNNIEKVVTDAEYVNECFNDLPSLKEVVFGDKVKTIGATAFHSCTGLTSLKIGKNVTEIQYDAFNGCTGLKTIDLGEKLETIGTGAFRECTGITSVMIPASVNKIKDAAFENAKIGSVTFADGNGKLDISFESYEKHPFSGCPIESLYIGRDLSGLNGNFSSFSSLKSVIFGNLVTSAPPLAFYDCGSLETVVFGENVSSIGGSAFAKCDNVKSITVLNPEPPTADYFSTTIQDNAKLIVPTGSIEKYKQAVPWKYFKNIVEQGEPSGITQLHFDNEGQTSRVYMIDGRISNNYSRGLVILKEANEKTRKILVR